MAEDKTPGQADANTGPQQGSKAKSAGTGSSKRKSNASGEASANGQTGSRSKKAGGSANKKAGYKSSSGQKGSSSKQGTPPEEQLAETLLHYIEVARNGLKMAEDVIRVIQAARNVNKNSDQQPG